VTKKMLLNCKGSFPMIKSERNALVLSNDLIG